MALDVISFSKAVQALKKAGFVGSKAVDETGIKDENIIRYSADLDKYISTELKTKVKQWELNHAYEKGEIVVFDDILHWVLTDHISHGSEIQYDIADGKIMPFVTESGFANVFGIEYTVQNEGENVLITWENPDSITYEGRKVFISETIDLTTMRFNECEEAVLNGQASLVTEGMGTGAGLSDSFLLSSETRRNYYVKIFVEHFEDDYKHSSGRGIVIENPDVYPPQAPKNLVVQMVDSKNLKLTWEQPIDSDFLHTKIVRSTIGYPNSPTDGTVLGSVSGSIGEYLDVGIEKGVVYYYSLFAFDDSGNGYEHGVEGNHSTATQATGIVFEILGFDFNTLSRIEGAELLEQSDFDSIYPWSDIKRAVVDRSGTVVYYLDENDSNFQEDGMTPAILDGTDGNVVVEYPQFYYKQEGGKVYVSQDEFTGATLIPRTLVGAFEGHKNETMGEMQSIAGVKPTTGKSISEYRLLASGNGEGWQNTDIHFLNILKALFAIEYGALNSQQLVGSGIVSEALEKNTGLTLSLGNKTGVGSGGAISYRGLENPWGNTWEFIEGLVITDTAYYIADTGFGNFVSDSNRGDYKKIEGVTPITQDGYISKFLGDGNFLASEVKGNSTLPVGDYQYSHREGETNLAVSGGNYEDGERAGIFRVHMGVKKFAVEEEMNLIEEFRDYTGVEFEATYETKGELIEDMTIGEEVGQLYAINLPKSLNDEEIVKINKIEIL